MTLKNQARRAREWWIPASCAAAIVAALVLSAPASAQALTWWTYKSSQSATVRSWYSVSTGAQYNQARTTTFNDASATAYVKIAGIGTSAAPGPTVSMSWGYYRTVTASCMWDGLGIWNGAQGILTCQLGY